MLLLPAGASQHPELPLPSPPPGDRAGKCRGGDDSGTPRPGRIQPPASCRFPRAKERLEDKRCWKRNSCAFPSFVLSFSYRRSRVGWKQAAVQPSSSGDSTDRLLKDERSRKLPKGPAILFPQPLPCSPPTTQAAPWLSIVHPTPQYGICTRSSQPLSARGLGCPTLQEFD